VAKAQSLTSIEQSPEDERKSRMIKYLIAMTIRVICIVLAMVVQGWFMWVCFAGAIFLPYFAVVIANGVGSGSSRDSAPKAVAPTLVIDASSFTSSTSPSDGPRAN
jgi:predicted tellurium resistance membrane protein TerC